MEAVNKIVIEDEAFSLRHGERICGQLDKPDAPFWIAIMLRSVQFPSGEKQVVRQRDNKPVESAAVLACHLVDSKWQWLQLAPATKEVIGDYFFDGGFPFDQWLYLTITRD